MSKEPHPTEEALQVLRGLLEAWRELSARPASDLVDAPGRAQSPAPHACGARFRPDRRVRRREAHGDDAGFAGSTIEREVAAEDSGRSLSPLSVRAIQQRLERILIDDRELLISLQCQLEQIRRELRAAQRRAIVRVSDSQDHRSPLTAGPGRAADSSTRRCPYPQTMSLLSDVPREPG